MFRELLKLWLQGRSAIFCSIRDSLRVFITICTHRRPLAPMTIPARAIVSMSHLVIGVPQILQKYVSWDAGTWAVA